MLSSNTSFISHLDACENKLADQAMFGSIFNKRSGKAEAAIAKLDAIEAEMKRIGFWSDDPRDLQARIESGELRSFLDAPSFELWLQCVFLPNAREAARSNKFPEKSQVGLMAMRQYDYHSHVAKAQQLLSLLGEFDRIVEKRT